MKELLLKRLKKSKNKKGFTLIEIIVVLVILGILAAIAVPAVMGYIDDAKESKYVAEAHSIYIVIQTEEARVKAINDDSYTYADLLTEAEDKTGLDITSITPDGGTADGKVIGSTDNNYTVTFKSEDNKTIEADINRNADITVKVS